MAGQQASELGAQVTRRNLNVQPTIKVSIGYRFNVRVNRDILFESPDIGAYGIRRGPWKYNLWSNGDEELYNVDDDPYELTNLLYDPVGPTGPTPQELAIAAQLKVRLAQLKTCNGDSCR